MHRQKDIVEVVFRFPDGTTTPHMVIVLSSNEAIEQEQGGFIGVVITSSDQFNDEFTFWLTDDMLSNPLPKKSQARIHLISSFNTEDIIPNKPNFIKEDDFVELLVRINETVFGLSLNDG